MQLAAAPSSSLRLAVALSVVAACCCQVSAEKSDSDALECVAAAAAASAAATDVISASAEPAQRCVHGIWKLKDPSKGCIGGVVCLCSSNDWGGEACDRAQWTGEPPNFVLIMLDDVGYGDVGYTGGVARTPNLDAMVNADDAIVFTNFHSGAPVCSPTRSSIITGRTPTRDCVDKAQGCMDNAECSMRFPLTLDEYSIVDLVHEYHNGEGGTDSRDVEARGKDSTYATGLWGKWHLGNVRPKPRTTKGMSQLSKFPRYVAHPGMFGFDEFSIAEDQVPAVQPNCACRVQSNVSNNFIFEKEHRQGGSNTHHVQVDTSPAWSDYTHAMYRVPAEWRAALNTLRDAPEGISSALDKDLVDKHYQNTDGRCFYGHYRPADETFHCTNYFSFPAPTVAVEPGHPDFSQKSCSSTACSYGGPTGSGLAPSRNKITTDDSTYLVDKFEDFVQRHARAKRPFLGFLWLHTVHHPFIASPAWQWLCLAGYACDLDVARAMKHRQASKKTEEGGKLLATTVLTPHEVDYHASIAQVDDQLGRVQDILEAHGVRNNTILIFTSDNGPEGPAGRSGNGVGSPTNPGSTGGFKGRKRDVWEGGHRVPFVLQWPARVHTNIRTNFPAVTMDYFATLQDILGLKPAASDTTSSSDWNRQDFVRDGESLLPFLTAITTRSLDMRLAAEHKTAPSNSQQLSDPLSDASTSLLARFERNSSFSKDVHSHVRQALDEDRARLAFLDHFVATGRVSSGAAHDARVLAQRSRPLGFEWSGGASLTDEKGQYKVVRKSFHCRDEPAAGNPRKKSKRHANPRESCGPALYDLWIDPFEEQNLKDAQPGVFKSLDKKLKDWLHQVDASRSEDSGCGPALKKVQSSGHTPWGTLVSLTLRALVAAISVIVLGVGMCEPGHRKPSSGFGCCGFFLFKSARGEYSSVATNDSAAFSPTMKPSNQSTRYRDDSDDQSDNESDDGSQTNSSPPEQLDPRPQASCSSGSGCQSEVSSSGQLSQVDSRQSRPERRIVSVKALGRSLCVGFMFAFCAWQLEALDYKLHLTGRNMIAHNLPFPKGSPATVLYLSHWTELLVQLVAVLLLSLSGMPRKHATASDESTHSVEAVDSGAVGKVGAPHCAAEPTKCHAGTRIVAACSMIAASFSLSAATGVQFVMAGSCASGVIFVLFLARCVRLPCTGIPVLQIDKRDEVQSASLERPATETVARSTTSIAALLVSCVLVASPWGMYFHASWWAPLNLVIGVSAAAGFARFFVFGIMIRHGTTYPLSGATAAPEQVPTATLVPCRQLNRMIFQVTTAAIPFTLVGLALAHSDSIAGLFRADGSSNGAANTDYLSWTSGLVLFLVFLVKISVALILRVARVALDVVQVASVGPVAAFGLAILVTFSRAIHSQYMNRRDDSAIGGTAGILVSLAGVELLAVAVLLHLHGSHRRFRWPT